MEFAQNETLLLGEHQRLGDEVEQGGRRGLVVRRRADHRPGLVERAEADVHVVHPRVGDPDAAHAHAEVGGEVLQRELLGARAVADDQLTAPGERVAGLEVRADAVAADVRRDEPCAANHASAAGVSIRRWG